MLMRDLAHGFSRCLVRHLTSTQDGNNLVTTLHAGKSPIQRSGILPNQAVTGRALNTSDKGKAEVFLLQSLLTAPSNSGQCSSLRPTEAKRSLPEEVSKMPGQL